MSLESATMTSILTFGLLVFYFFLGTRWWRTSLDHFVQNVSTILWQNSNRWRGFEVSRNGPCGTVFVAFPLRISFGHKYVPPSGSSDSFPKGRWIKRLAASRRQVYKSIGVKIVSPIAFFNAAFVDFIIEPEQPFWWETNGAWWMAISSLCPNPWSYHEVHAQLQPFESCCPRSLTLYNHGRRKIVVGLVENPWYWHLWLVQNGRHTCSDKWKSLHNVLLSCSYQALLW